MILKTIDIVSLYRKLIEISQREELIMPVKLSFKLLRNSKTIEPIALSFEEASNSTIMKYANPLQGEDVGKMEISKEDFEKVKFEIKELEDEDVDIPLLPIKLSELEDLDLTMRDLAGLYPIIENEEA